MLSLFPVVLGISRCGPARTANGIRLHYSYVFAIPTTHILCLEAVSYTISRVFPGGKPSQLESPNRGGVTIPLNLIDGAAGLDPVVEAAEIAHVGVAEVHQGLAGKCRAPARCAIQRDRPVLGERRIVARQRRVGLELDGPARRMDGAGGFAEAATSRSSRTSTIRTSPGSIAWTSAGVMVGTRALASATSCITVSVNGLSSGFGRCCGLGRASSAALDVRI